MRCDRASRAQTRRHLALAHRRAVRSHTTDRARDADDGTQQTRARACVRSRSRAVDVTPAGARSRTERARAPMSAREGDKHLIVGAQAGDRARGGGSFLSRDSGRGASARARRSRVIGHAARGRGRRAPSVRDRRRGRGSTRGRRARARECAARRGRGVERRRASARRDVARDGGRPRRGGAERRVGRSWNAAWGRCRSSCAIRGTSCRWFA